MDSLAKLSAAKGACVAVPFAPLPQHIARWASSDETALAYADETCNVRVSYAEMEARTNALARAIAARARTTGANRDGDFIVAVCMQPTPNTIIALLGTWKAGAAYLPVEPIFPYNRIGHILKDAQPSLIIYDDVANPSIFSAISAPAVSFEELALDASGMSTDYIADEETLSQPSVDSIAIVLYTSGSTGFPKGVRLPYSAICNRLWWQFRTFPFSTTEVTCVWKTALTFGDSICEIWGPLVQGRTLVILSRAMVADPQKLVQILSENKIQRIVLVPTLLRSILMCLSLDQSKRPLTLLKMWVCSGETLTKELAVKFFQYFGDQDGFKLGNFYGSTEVMGDVTFYMLEKSEQLHLHPTIPIGEPLDNCAVYLLDEVMNPVQKSEPGEIWVAGLNMAAGYVGGQGADKFCDNPHSQHPDYRRLYRTGDFGILQNGVILYAGRTDSQVKIRGHRVELQEIDREVTAVEGIDKCVVLCYGVKTGSPEILAFVTLEPEARLMAHQIEAKLKDSLTNYMIPQVIIVENIPLQVNGKVDRQALLKMYENTNNNDDSSISLEIDYIGVDQEYMEAAKVLFETVGEVLGRSVRGAISVRADFYELGGHSLNSIYTITKLRDKGYYIEISDFLKAKNLGEVLSHMTTKPDDNSKNKKPEFTVDLLKEDDEQKVIDMIVCSFCEPIQDDLQECRLCKLQTKDYAQYVHSCWDALLKARLSILLKDSTGTPVAVAINCDGRDEPKAEVSGCLAKTMAYLDHVERPVRDTMLPEGKGAILHSMMMATNSNLCARDNVAAIHALEKATISIAKERRFKGVFATNTNPLTQQLGTDVFGYQTLLDYQINQYVDENGRRPFSRAGDDVRALVCWKSVN
ncbi:hypothetical protein ABMA27_009326 [Loxostege sticticalis]|uniref:Carrier domain-containing protein n=1 Tax=Loxostege sticticalis TaxID=481309 RepID=A0ABR3H7M5_LOXSC